MKHLLLLAVVLAMATTAFASPCMFTSAPVGPCTEGDKDFSVFTINPGLPAGTTVSIAQSGPNVYEVKFNNDAGIKNAFNFTYTVTLNGLCPTCFISEVDAGITGGVNPALLETHVTPLVPAGASNRKHYSSWRNPSIHGSECHVG